MVNSNLAAARNVRLQLSGGDNVLSDQIYANWPKVPIGYGCISAGNGSTVGSGTYIKYSDTTGSMTVNDVGGNIITWSIVNGTYNLHHGMSGFLISPITATTDAAGLAHINLPGMVMAVCTSSDDTTLELIKNQYGMYYVHVKKYSDGTNYVGTFDFWVLHSFA